MVGISEAKSLLSLIICSVLELAMIRLRLLTNSFTLVCSEMFQCEFETLQAPFIPTTSAGWLSE